MQVCAFTALTVGKTVVAGIQPIAKRFRMPKGAGPGWIRSSSTGDLNGYSSL